MEVLPYNPSSYNMLPQLHDAEQNFHSAGADSLVPNEIRQCFIDNKMDTTFGLALLHRHFDLADNERLVEYNGTSTPWDLSDRPSTTSHLKPTVWGLTSEGLLQPYEFAFAPRMTNPVDITKDEHKDFVRKLSSLLKERKAEGLFGLCPYPGDDWKSVVEVTEGRTNINLKPEDVDLSDPNVHPIIAAWYFSPALWGNAAAKCRALGQCKPPPRVDQELVDCKICYSYKRADGSYQHIYYETPAGTSVAGSATDEPVPMQQVKECLRYVRADGDIAHRVTSD